MGLATELAVIDSAGRILPAGAQALVERAIAAATGAADAVAGMRRLFTPADVVGIKVNCLAGKGLSTRPEVVDALAALLAKSGVRADNIVIWDRTDRELLRAGYPVRRSGVGPLVLGTNDDYENEPIESGSVAGCLSRLLTRRLTAVINVPILKDHDLAGISGALKNFYGAIHNPNKLHRNGCSPFIADLYAHAAIRDKVRLTVFDALVPQCHGGPAYSPAHTWHLGTVFASTDPVAADSVALRLIAARRAATGLPTLEKDGRAPAWLAQAAAAGLGVADRSRLSEVTR